MLLIGNAACDDAERHSHDGPVNPIHSDTYRLCEEVETSRLLCIEASGTLAKPQWEVRLAAQVVGDTVGRAFLHESITILQHDADGLTDEKLREHIYSKVNDMGHSSGYDDVSDI